ncbi:hypothetical protein G3N55_11475 [Dissulfurirhabdus thermomarina]|uniref:Rho termination factor-like N-terminal domain-containing protein n=1 Tax=Dissulfurirhabdus thermomarina TaxID=1765737 RepID=A0A6N9TQK6_DISTH|nr:Rho termination factor N-terminal domain-containing protein [Dissulfurirhabdus thermomarina]NDY43459.1 hypothetical protein [Dissulfurirhabdus thermomarina]NMX22646.1 hypothetical protein [Dissulfurirhabdus thermomarina]
MKLAEIRNMAKALKVKNYSRRKKNDLIWAIQLAEGHTDCFLKIPGCGVMDCLWRPDCQRSC